MTERSTEIKVGIFVLIGIAVLFYLTIKLGEEAFTPKDSYPVYAMFQNVSGLLKGAKVNIAGVTVGKVGDIELTPEGKAKVKLLIYKKYKIAEDSKAVIRTFGVLGDKYVEIEPGHSSRYLSPGEVISRTEGAVELDEVLSSIGPAIEGLKEILGSEEGKQNLKELVVSFKETARSINEVAKKVESGKGTLGRLLTDESLYNELTSTIKDIKFTAQNLKKVAIQISQGQGTLGKLVKDDTLYQKLNILSARLTKLSEKLEKGQGTLGKLLTDDSLYADLKSTARSLKIIAQKIERGEGTLGRFINDDSLYVEIKKTLKSVNRAANSVEDQVPISILGTVAGAAMK